MTHEELLEKIQTFLVATELQSINEDFEGTKMLKAIRRVVELHKPWETLPNVDFKQLVWCEACEEDYPCPTIQAIEKELI